MPIPYCQRDDDTVVLIIVICTIMGLLALATVGNQILREIKSFIYTRDYSFFFGNAIERTYKYVLCGQTALLLALGIYLIDEEYTIWLYIGIFSLYFIMRYILYYAINYFYFSAKQAQNWNHSLILITAVEGLFLFPLIVACVYFSLPIKIAFYSAIAIVVCAKLSLFYKANRMFFGTLSGLLQNILYFCMLEIGPLLLLREVLTGFIGN